MDTSHLNFVFSYLIKLKIVAKKRKRKNKKLQRKCNIWLKPLLQFATLGWIFTSVWEQASGVRQ